MSFVMPTYNGREHINCAVRSVLEQQGADWEMIVSDDGSTDGTREYLEAIADPRVRLFFQSERLGIFGNLNFCIARASAPIVQILCQDDSFTGQDSLAAVLRQWEELPEDIAFLRMNFGAETLGKKKRRFPMLDLQRRVVPRVISPEQSDLLFFVFGCIPGNLSNVSLRKRILETEGVFQQRLPFAGDFEFWSRVGTRMTWAVCDRVVAFVRDHERQATRQLNRKGELVPQLAEIVDGLYGRLVLQGHDRRWLRLQATVNYAALHRDVGLKQVLRGRGTGYLATVEKNLGAASFSLGPFASWMVYLLSAGGRLGRAWVARRTLKSGAARAALRI